MSPLPPHSVRRISASKINPDCVVEKKLMLKLSKLSRPCKQASISVQRNTDILCPVCSLWSRNDRKTKCVPKCRNISSQWSNPVFQRRKHTFGSIREETVRNSREPCGDSATSREITFRRREGVQPPEKNPWNFCEELEGYPDSCNSNRLDYSSLMTSFPALHLQPCSLQTWSSGAEQAGGSRVIAPPTTDLPQIYALSCT